MKPPTIDLGYEYVNARLRVMRTRLFQREEYPRLLAAADIPGLIAALDRSPYQEALRAALATHSGVLAVHRALQLDQNATLQRIAGFCGGDSARAFHLLTAPCIRHNIITLLRGVAAHAPATDILPLLTIFPPFSEGVLDELARQPTVRRLIHLLDQWALPTPELARTLITALNQSADARFLERRFHHAWAEAVMREAEALSGECATLLQRNLRLSLDMHNLLLALDFQGIPLDAPPDYLPNGQLDISVLEAFRTAPDLGEMTAALASEPAGALWLPALNAWDGQDRVALQLAWEQTLLHWRVSLFYTADPLGPGILIAYLAAKEAELRNLRLIAEAAAEHIPRDVAEAHLMLV